MNLGERLLRMFRLHRDEIPDVDEDDPDLTEARDEVDALHRQAKRVLTDYAAADQQRRHAK